MKWTKVQDINDAEYSWIPLRFRPVPIFWYGFVSLANNSRGEYKAKESERAKFFCTPSQIDFFWKLIEEHQNPDDIIDEFGYRMYYAIKGIDPTLGWAETMKYYIRPFQNDIAKMLDRLAGNLIPKKHNNDRRHNAAAKRFCRTPQSRESTEALKKLQIYIKTMATDPAEKLAFSEDLRTIKGSDNRFSHFAPHKGNSETADRNFFIRIMYPFFNCNFKKDTNAHVLKLTRIFFPEDSNLDIDTIHEQGKKWCCHDIAVEELMPGDYWDLSYDEMSRLIDSSHG